jgi:DNA-binding NarL/FixJ family response regulator
MPRWNNDAPVKMQTPRRVLACGSLFNDLQWLRIGARLGLTPRQLLMAQHVCRGETYKFIALDTGLSINTVRMHLRALYAKLGEHDRVGVVLQIVNAERDLPAHE